MAILSRDSTHRAVMHFIVIFFGIGAWVAVNGAFVELPILVSKLPEHWNLPSFLVILMQAANVGPLVVVLMQVFLSQYYNQNVLIYVMLALGTSSCLLLILFWDFTAYISGVEHSVALFILFLFLGFVDCTSSLTFLPFMTNFQQVFLTTYFLGEGLSGFLPSIFAIIQGVSNSYCKNESYVNTTTNQTEYHIVTKYHDPRFPVEVFFGFLCLMMLLCSFAFIVLNYSKSARNFTNYEPLPDDDTQSTSTVYSSLNSDEDRKQYFEGHEDGMTQDKDGILPVQVPIRRTFTRSQYIFFYAIIFWLSCVANGVMPSVASYSSLPYGQLPYHFAATFGTMANPLACLIALFLPVKSHKLVGIPCGIATGFAAFLMYLAVESPCPVLVHNVGGAVLMVLSQVLFVFTTSYTKVSIAQILREYGFERAILWYGAFTQLGALIGACTIFPLVNVYHLFTAGDQCTTVCPG